MVQKIYSSKDLGHYKVSRGKWHNYLGIFLDYNEKGKLQVNMKYHMRKMI